MPSEFDVLQPHTYRHVAEGYGGTIETPPSLPYKDVGTRNLITCVGLYFPIPDGRCFVAHINAFIEPMNNAEIMPRARTLERQCKADKEGNESKEGQEIKRLTLVKLHAAGALGKWCPDKIDAEEVRVVCPHLQNGHPNTGKYVFAAIREFFKHGDIPTPITDSHGFIVDPTEQTWRLLKAGKFKEEYVQPDNDGFWSTWLQELDEPDQQQRMIAQTIAWPLLENWYIRVVRQAKAHTDMEGTLIWEE